MVWLANAGLVHNYIILLCVPPLWHLGVTVAEGLGKSDLPKLKSIRVDSHHTEAARTTTGSTAMAKATSTTATKKRGKEAEARRPLACRLHRCEHRCTPHAI